MLWIELIVAKAFARNMKAPTSLRLDYDSDARMFERLASRVATLLPDLTVTRTTEVIQLSGVGELAILLLTPDALEVRLPTIDWVHGAYAPRPSTRLLRRYKLQQFLDHFAEEGVEEAATQRILVVFREACITRSKEFRTCRYCGESFPPEHRDSRSVCHGCAEAHLGVVH